MKTTTNHENVWSIELVYVKWLCLYLSSRDGGQGLRLQLLRDVRHRVCYNH